MNSASSDRCKTCGMTLADGVCPSCKTLVVGAQATVDIPSEVEAAAQKKANLFGRYILIARIGQGGMGTVYRAWDGALNRICAVKTLLPNLDTDSDVTYREQVDRFLREARTAARLSHPNIVQVYDVGSVDNTHYIAMEYVPGETLKRYHDRIVLEETQGGSTSRVRRDRLEKTLWIMHDVIRAVGLAHLQGVVHRDIKPENIFLTVIGEKTVPKVGDFGLAKEITESRRITMSGTALGTPYYMSPEQAEGKRDVDARSDVFSLGSVLYEMSTGSLPFQGEGSMGIMRAVVDKDPLPPHKINTAIDRDLATIILKALEKERQRRYADGEALADDLKRHLLGETILARPATLVYRIGKKIRRHRIAASLLTVALVLLTAVGVYAIVSGRLQRAVVKELKEEKGHVEDERARLEREKALQEQAMKTAMPGWMIASEVTAEFYKKEADMGKVWKRLETALKILDDSIAIRPTAPAHFYRGRIYLMYLDYDRAEQDFTQAATLDDKMAEARVFLGLTHMGRFAETFIDEDHPQIQRREEGVKFLLRAEEELKHIGETVVGEEFLPFIALVKTLTLIGKQDHDQSLAQLNEGFQRYRREEFLYWSAIVAYYAKQGHLSPALFAERALEIRPQYPEACILLGCLEEDVGTRTEIFTKVIAINPRMSAAYLNRGDALMHHGDYQKAESDFSAAIALRPLMAEAWEHRSRAKNERKDYGGALADIDRAIELNPRDPHMLVRRAEIKAENNHLQSAKEDYAAALKIGVEHSSFYYRMGSLLWKMNDYDGAIEHFDRAIALEPNESRYYYDRGVSKMYKTDNLGALKDYNKAIELDPKNIVALYFRGRILSGFGYHERAIADLKKAIEIDPKYSTYFYNEGIARLYLGDAYERKGDDVSAVIEWKKAGQLSSKVQDAVKPRIRRAETRLKNKGM